LYIFSYPIWHHVSIGRSVMIVEHQNGEHDAARHHEHDAIEIWSWIEVFPKIPRRKNTKRKWLVTEIARIDAVSRSLVENERLFFWIVLAW